MPEYRFELKNAIKQFIDLADSLKKGGNLSTQKVIKAIQNETDDSNFKVKIESIQSSLGKGNPAFVPYISFLGPGQAVQKGVYPCLLYYKTLKPEDKQLILAYGVSEKKAPSIKWNFEKLKDVPITIGNHFKLDGISNNYSRRHIRYQDSYIYKVYKPDFDYSTIENDTNTLINFYINNTDFNITPVSPSIVKPDQVHKSSLISDFSKDVKLSGLMFDDLMLKRFVTALETKPFVILSGLAGSGKTKLAQVFSNWISKDDSQICMVPVQSDWVNREPLLGYPDALNRGKYIKDDYGVIDILNEANRHPDLPYFLILDEMNLSYVERYFADFLSAMESQEKIKLWNNPDEQKKDSVPSKISLSNNLFIIGTINVDETTYMFSPKVLDRASVIEFRATADSVRKFLSNNSSVDLSKVAHKGSKYSKNFLDSANKSVTQNPRRNEIINDLVGFFSSLKKVNAEFGFRTAAEINKYVNLSIENGMTLDEAIDTAIFQKLLPKLHGSRKKLINVLNELIKLCKKDSASEDLKQDDDNQAFNKEKFKYPLSAEKIYRMQSAAEDNGFTSFAEA